MERSSINFHAQPFSLLDHLLHPFSQKYSSKAQEQRSPVLKLHFKVASVALAIIAGVAAVAAAGKLAGAILGTLAFYAVTGLIKSRLPESIKSLAKKTESLPQKAFQPIHEAADELRMDVISFYYTIFKPVLEPIFRSAPNININLCYIQTKTAPFTEWLQKEYQGVDSSAKRNLQYFRTAHPSVDNGLFVNIRADGDDTFRSIGAGLILQACSHHDPVKAVKELFYQFQEIGQQLVESNANILRIIDVMNDKVESSQDNSTFLLYLHVASLREVNNQQKINFQIVKLQTLMSDLKSYFDHQMNNKTTDDSRIIILTLMQNVGFDTALISFLRNASALYTILNADMMLPLNIPSFELLIQKADARQPKEENLKGSLVDIFILSELFKQPINFFHCQTFFDLENGGNQFGEDFKEGKNQLFILNSLGRSDLILM